jgi:hypothetical protein
VNGSLVTNRFPSANNARVKKSSLKKKTGGAMYQNWLYTEFRDFAKAEDVTAWPLFKFAVYQYELCPDTGRTHIQGYVVFSRRVSMKHCKSILPRAHWENRMGSHEQAVDYCSKLRTRLEKCTPVTVGDPPKPGKRTDIDDLAEAVCGGASLRSLCFSYPAQMIKYHKGVQWFQMMTSERRTWPMTVYVLYGPTGLGKSQMAFAMGGLDCYYVPANTDKNTIWFDAYQGEKTVIMEEFSGYSCLFGFLLRLLDRYPLNTPFKGGHCNFSADTIIITSNYAPEDWYKWDSTKYREYEPLERRLTHIFKFVGRDQYEVIKGQPVNLDGYVNGTGYRYVSPEPESYDDSGSDTDVLDYSTPSISPPRVRKVSIRRSNAFILPEKSSVIDSEAICSSDSEEVRSTGSSTPGSLADFICEDEDVVSVDDPAFQRYSVIDPIDDISPSSSPISVKKVKPSRVACSTCAFEECICAERAERAKSLSKPRKKSLKKAKLFI